MVSGGEFAGPLRACLPVIEENTHRHQRANAAILLLAQE
jgi:hypothetical protein